MKKGSESRSTFPFSPFEWRSSNSLRICSLAARGLWIEMLCIAFLSERRGYLQAGGRPISTGALARMVGASIRRVEEGIKELESAGVLDRDKEGVIFSSRMEAQFRLARIRSEAGRKGGRARQKGARATEGRP